VTVESRAGDRPAIWIFPDDPALPGLTLATDGRLVRRRLRPRPAHVAVQPLRYRPRRRAVLRYLVTGAGVLYAKVLPPAPARRLLAAADAIRAGGDVDPGDPVALRLALPAGRLGAGVLAGPALPGRTLRDLLLAGAALPAPERVAALPEALDRCARSAFGRGFPAPAPPPGRRQVDACTALAAARVVARLLPGGACTAARLAEAVIGWSEASETPRQSIIHGDLYENQVLVDGERFGLIDLDDLGPGDPLLDGANFSAHLLILGTSGSPAAGVILRYREELRRAFCDRLDASPSELAWRESYCLLRLATGPFRVLHPDWPRRMADRLTLAVEALGARR
jgi:hypothetical protein